ncbi:RNA pyrophosphohydrolase [Caedimonas varicaedens]|uniref:RNA pyrophosphohydrolase n=1 Tax=Caedimonas varicaedens TaxID=1629334 RepID=A0A0K8MES8_9PROT|nr:RNA pyrophosphohydrolase [Caedimonas varicaedens]
MTFPSSQHLPYRQGVGMMVLNTHQQVFVARRIDLPSGSWQMPQGGIDKGETPLEAALRELAEEIGTNNVRMIAESREWYHYDLPDRLIARLWKGRYRGQQQKWFAMEFLGNETEINLNTAHPEFSEWRWVSLSELPTLAVSFKRKTYEQIIEEFLPCIDKT